MSIGKRIQQARKAAKLSQKDLGERLGVSASMIGQYENDLRNPKVETLLRIAEALNVSMYYLTGGTDDPTNHSKTHWGEAVVFSENYFVNSDGKGYTFSGGTYLAKVSSISNGLGETDQEKWLQIGDTMIDLDNDDRKKLVDHASLLANQTKYKKEPHE